MGASKKVALDHAVALVVSRPPSDPGVTWWLCPGQRGQVRFWSPRPDDAPSGSWAARLLQLPGNARSVEYALRISIEAGLRSVTPPKTSV